MTPGHTCSQRLNFKETFAYFNISFSEPHRNVLKHLFVLNV